MQANADERLDSVTICLPDFTRLTLCRLEIPVDWSVGTQSTNTRDTPADAAALSHVGDCSGRLPQLKTTLTPYCVLKLVR